MSVNDPMYDDNVPDQLFDGEPVAVHADSLVDGNTPTPPVTNVRGYIPYRGSEQHGVRFTEESEGRTKRNGYEAEQKAYENYVDPTVTPRDIVPVQPIAVKVVEQLDLLKNKIARVNRYALDVNSGWVCIASAVQSRTRLQVRVSRRTGGYTVMQLSPSAQPSELQSYECNSGSNEVLIDTEMTGPLWARIIGTDATEPHYISVWSEYGVHNGEKLL